MNDWYEITKGNKIINYIKHIYLSMHIYNKNDLDSI